MTETEGEGIHLLDGDIITPAEYNPLDYVMTAFRMNDRMQLEPQLAGFTSVLRHKFAPVTFNDTMYIYDWDTGLYSEDRGVISSMIQSLAEKAKYDKSLNRLKREILQQCKDTTVVGADGKYPFNQYPGFPVENGVLVFDGDTVQLIPYTPGMLFTRKIHTAYIPDREANADIISAMDDWIGLENTGILFQIAAQAIIQALPGREPFKKAYLIQGESNGGKSTFLKLLELTFGDANISQLSLQDVCGRDNFAKARMVGKYLNVGDDLQDVAAADGAGLKQITGKRTHDVNEKGKPRFTADITAVHVYACNRPPETTDKLDRDDAFWNRWEYIRFPNYFTTNPNWISEHLTEDAVQGFFNGVIRLACKILKNGELPYASDGAVSKELWKHDSSPMLEFIEEHTDPCSSKDKDCGIPKEYFIACYEDWVETAECTDFERDERRRRSPKTKKQYTQKMMQEGYDEYRRGKKEGVEMYRGLAWKVSSKYRIVSTVNSTL